jgi:hypothetical protein
MRCALTLALILAAAPGLAAQGGRRDRRTPEEQKAENIREATQRLSRLAARTDLTPENRTLNQKATALVDRSRNAPADSYLLDRLESAVDDLLDASEQIIEARLPGGGNGGRGGDRGRIRTPDEARRETVRELERSYFRIQQGDYFARQSQEADANDYLVVSRRLYQLARAAYDSGDYGAAHGFAEASEAVIQGLESLAQAAVPVPVPPQLPEG